MSFEARRPHFTGCTVELCRHCLGAWGPMPGINCSLGPKEIFSYGKAADRGPARQFPVFVKPNAGCPRADGSGYDISPPQLYAMQMALPGAGPVCRRRLLRHHLEFIQLLNGVFADCRLAALTTP